MVDIRIRIGGLVFEARIDETPIATALLRRMPFSVGMTRWGDEYYGPSPVRFDSAPDGREIMEVGEIAYWQPGNALCIFFGPTPASTDSRPRAASAVVPIGSIVGDLVSLKELGPHEQAEFLPK